MDFLKEIIKIYINTIIIELDVKKNNKEKEIIKSIYYF